MLNSATPALSTRVPTNEAAINQNGPLTGLPHRRDGFENPSSVGRLQRRTVNVRLLIRTVFIVACTMIAVVLIHENGSKSVAGALLDRARELREAKQYLKSANYLNRYVSLRPDDEHAAIELAETYDLAAKSTEEIQRAIEFYYRAVGLAASSNLPDVRARELGLRCRLAELLLALAPTRLEMLPAAIDQAGYLPEQDSASDLSVRGWRVVAISRYLLSQEKVAYNPNRNPAWKDETIGVAAIGLPISDILERALVLAPGNVTLSMTLAHGIYRDPVKAREQIVAGPLTDSDLVRRADRIVDTMVRASRHELVRFLRDRLGSPLPMVVASGDSLLNLEETAISDNMLREVYKTAEHRLTIAPAELPLNAQRYLGSRVIESIRSGQLPSVRRKLIDAELEGKEIGSETLGFLDRNAEIKRSVTPAQEIVVGNWILQHEHRLVETCLQLPLQFLNRKYVTALLARYTYRTEYKLPGASADLHNALQQGPDELLAVLLAAQDERDRARTALMSGQQKPAIDHYRTAIDYFKRAIRLAPLEESLYLALGDIYATCPDCSLNDGRGIVGDLGEQGSLVANHSLRVLVTGFCNDFIITPSLSRASALPITIATIHQNARGDEAIVRFNRTGNKLTIDVDPKETTALAVVRAFDRCAGFTAALDNHIDHAVATWESAKQTIQHDTIDVDLRLAGAYLANGNYVKGDRLVDEISRAVDVSASRLSAAEHRQLQRRIFELRAKSLIAKGDYEKGVALLKSSLADRDPANSSGQIEQLQLLGSALAALGKWKDAAGQFEKASTIAPSQAALRLAAASCWVRADDVEAATRQYLHALQIEERPPTRLAMACAQLVLRRRQPLMERELAEFTKNAQLVDDQKLKAFLMKAVNEPALNTSKLVELSSTYLEQHATDQAVHAVELVLRPKADDALAAVDLSALLHAHE